MQDDDYLDTFHRLFGTDLNKVRRVDMLYTGVAEFAERLLRGRPADRSLSIVAKTIKENLPRQKTCLLCENKIGSYSELGGVVVIGDRKGTEFISCFVCLPCDNSFVDSDWEPVVKNGLEKLLSIEFMP